ncbi:MAG: hypothetical protein HOP20_11165 [Sulfuriferula sp.]|nr:hypothetical protein [Sulfuriferula sp.]
MYIIFFAFLYIWVMLLVTSTSWVAGISVFIFGGGLLAVVYYLLDTPGRKIRRLAREQDEEDNPPQS